MSAAEHARRQNFRQDRHAVDEASEDDEVDVNGERIDSRQTVSEADRMRVLRALPPVAKQIAEAMLNTYWNFDAAALFTLALYARSCERLAQLQAARAPRVEKLHQEIGINLQLLGALRRG